MCFQLMALLLRAIMITLIALLLALAVTCFLGSVGVTIPSSIAAFAIAPTGSYLASGFVFTVLTVLAALAYVGMETTIIPKLTRKPVLVIKTESCLESCENFLNDVTNSCR
jgi:hypothetical protein